MSRFDREVLDACRAVDAEFSECILYLPRAPSDDRSAADAADTGRPTLTLRGVFIEKYADPKEPNSYDVRQARRPGMATVDLWLEIAPGEIEQALMTYNLAAPFKTRADDMIQRVENGATYRIAAAPMISVAGVLKARLNRIA